MDKGSLAPSTGLLLLLGCTDCPESPSRQVVSIWNRAEGKGIVWTGWNEVEFNTKVKTHVIRGQTKCSIAYRVETSSENKKISVLNWLYRESLWVTRVMDSFKNMKNRLPEIPIFMTDIRLVLVRFLNRRALGCRNEIKVLIRISSRYGNYIYWQLEINLQYFAKTILVNWRA